MVYNHKALGRYQAFNTCVWWSHILLLNTELNLILDAAIWEDSIHSEIHDLVKHLIGAFSRTPEYMYTKRHRLISTDNYSGVCVISKYQQTTSELRLVEIVLNIGL